MKAQLQLRERVVLSENVFAEIVIWHVPASVKGSHHDFKYRLALVADAVCVMRYENEADKGDYRHIGDQQSPVAFIDIDALIAAFWTDVDEWLANRGDEQ